MVKTIVLKALITALPASDAIFQRIPCLFGQEDIPEPSSSGIRFSDASDFHSCIQPWFGGPYAGLLVDVFDPDMTDADPGTGLSLGGRCAAPSYSCRASVNRRRSMVFGDFLVRDHARARAIVAIADTETLPIFPARGVSVHGHT